MKWNVDRVEALLEEKGLEKLVVVDGGFIAWMLHIPYDLAINGLAVIIERGRGVTVVTPPLETLRVRSLLGDHVEIVAYSKYGVFVEGFRVVEGGLKDALCKLVGGRVAVDEKAQRVMSECRLEIVNVSDALWRLRMVKEGWEVEAISEAVRVTEEAIIKLMGLLEEGMSEAEAAGLLELWLRRLGSEGHAFVTAGGLSIVAFGVNTSYPHYTPTTRSVLREGPVLVDTGAVIDSYCGDVTRTWWYGGNPEAEWRKVLELIEEAVGEAIDAAQPGVEARVVDEAARKRLGKYARYFIHATGHGIGVEVHEKPGISPASTTKLEKGMVFTIEPGVYLPGRFGARIEQVVVVEERRARVLNKLPARL